MTRSVTIFKNSVATLLPVIRNIGAHFKILVHGDRVFKPQFVMFLEKISLDKNIDPVACLTRLTSELKVVEEALSKLDLHFTTLSELESELSYYNGVISREVSVPPKVSSFCSSNLTEVRKQWREILSTIEASTVVAVLCEHQVVVLAALEWWYLFNLEIAGSAISVAVLEFQGRVPSRDALLSTHHNAQQITTTYNALMALANIVGKG